MDLEMSIGAAILGLSVDPVRVPDVLGEPDDPGNEDFDWMEQKMQQVEQRLREETWKAPFLDNTALVFLVPQPPGSDGAVLNPQFPVNKPFIEFENLLSQLEREVESLLPSLGPAQNFRGESMLHEIREAQLILCKKRQDSSNNATSAHVANLKDKSILYINTDDHFPHLQHRQSPTVLAACLLVTVFHLLRFGTRLDCQYWLLGMQGLLAVALQERNPREQHGNVTPQIPKTLQTAISQFEIDPSLTSYTCAWKDFEDAEPCGYTLASVAPSWWGRQLCRPGLEKEADLYPRQLEYQEISHDIWTSRRLRRLEFKDGETARSSDTTTGRYVFSFGVDWFGAHGGKSGKAHSIGAVYLICQNLPPALRFREDNVCLVGLIPGPRKPHGQQVNHFLQPLVDDFKIFWNGVYYSRTYSHPEGRLVYGALGPVIGDLDACRAVAGFASHSHTFCCSYCRVQKQELAEINPRRWDELKRTVESHREFAAAWKEAPSAVLRKQLFDQYATTWTPLMELEYWDPTKDCVLDPMHNLFLGLASTHCEKVWLMNTDVPGGDGSGWLVKAAPSIMEMIIGRMSLRNTAGGSNRLKRTPKPVLEALCAELGLGEKLRPQATKQQMIAVLLEWAAIHSMELEDDITRAVEELQSIPRENWKQVDVQHLRQLCLNLIETEEVEEREWIMAVSKDDVVKWLETKLPETRHLTIEDLQAEEQLYARSRDNWSTLPKEVLVRMANRCWSIGDPPLRGPDDNPLTSVWTCAELASYLNERLSNDAPDFSPRSNTRLRRTRTVLGSNILKKVWDDLDQTVLPSWVNPLPRGIGTKTFGSPTADQWRLFTTMALPMTLIPIWGQESPSTRFYQMLENFMHLVVILDLGARRTTSKDRRAAITMHTLKYLEGIRVLFPQATIPPNFHLIYHLPDFLKYFGPVHSWWAFPFERLNGILQKRPINNRFAELEKTIMRGFIRGANLLALFQDNLLPPELSSFYELVKQHMTKEYSGALDKENQAWGSGSQWTVYPAAAPLHLSVGKWFLGKDKVDKKYAEKAKRIRKLTGKSFLELQECSKLFHRGASYIPIAEDERRFWKKGKDSTIQYWRTAHAGDGTEKHLAAGRIVEIWSRKKFDTPVPADEDTLVMVQRYVELQDEEKANDPFLRWNGCGGRVVLNSFHPELDVIQVGNIISHLARCPLGKGSVARSAMPSQVREPIIVWSLDRMIIWIDRSLMTGGGQVGLQSWRYFRDKGHVHRPNAITQPSRDMALDNSPTCFQICVQDPTAVAFRVETVHGQQSEELSSATRKLKREFSETVDNDNYDRVVVVYGRQSKRMKEERLFAEPADHSSRVEEHVQSDGAGPGGRGFERTIGTGVAPSFPTQQSSVQGSHLDPESGQSAPHVPNIPSESTSVPPVLAPTPLIPVLDSVQVPRTSLSESHVEGSTTFSAYTTQQTLFSSLRGSHPSLLNLASSSSTGVEPDPQPVTAELSSSCPPLPSSDPSCPSSNASHGLRSPPLSVPSALPHIRSTLALPSPVPLPPPMHNSQPTEVTSLSHARPHMESRQLQMVHSLQLAMRSGLTGLAEAMEDLVKHLTQPQSAPLRDFYTAECTFLDARRRRLESVQAQFRGWQNETVLRARHDFGLQELRKTCEMAVRVSDQQCKLLQDVIRIRQLALHALASLEAGGADEADSVSAELDAMELEDTALNQVSPPSNFSWCKLLSGSSSSPDLLWPKILQAWSIRRQLNLRELRVLLHLLSTAQGRLSFVDTQLGTKVAVLTKKAETLEATIMERVSLVLGGSREQVGTGDLRQLRNDIEALQEDLSGLVSSLKSSTPLIAHDDPLILQFVSGLNQVVRTESTEGNVAFVFPVDTQPMIAELNVRIQDRVERLQQEILAALPKVQAISLHLERCSGLAECQAGVTRLCAELDQWTTVPLPPSMTLATMIGAAEQRIDSLKSLIQQDCHNIRLHYLQLDQSISRDTTSHGPPYSAAVLTLQQNLNIVEARCQDLSTTLRAQAAELRMTHSLWEACRHLEEEIVSTHRFLTTAQKNLDRLDIFTTESPFSTCRAFAREIAEWEHHWGQKWTELSSALAVARQAIEGIRAFRTPQLEDVAQALICKSYRLERSNLSCRQELGHIKSTASAKAFEALLESAVRPRLEESIGSASLQLTSGKLHLESALGDVTDLVERNQLIDWSAQLRAASEFAESFKGDFLHSFKRDVQTLLVFYNACMGCLNRRESPSLRRVQETASSVTRLAAEYCQHLDIWRTNFEAVLAIRDTMTQAEGSIKASHMAYDKMEVSLVQLRAEFDANQAFASLEYLESLADRAKDVLDLSTKTLEWRLGQAETWIRKLEEMVSWSTKEYQSALDQQRSPTQESTTRFENQLCMLALQCRLRDLHNVSNLYRACNVHFSKFRQEIAERHAAAAREKQSHDMDIDITPSPSHPSQAHSSFGKVASDEVADAQTATDGPAKSLPETPERQQIPPVWIYHGGQETPGKVRDSFGRKVLEQGEIWSLSFSDAVKQQSCIDPKAILATRYPQNLIPSTECSSIICIIADCNLTFGGKTARTRWFTHLRKDHSLNLERQKHQGRRESSAPYEYAESAYSGSDDGSAAPPQRKPHDEATGAQQQGLRRANVTSTGVEMAPPVAVASNHHLRTPNFLQPEPGTATSLTPIQSSHLLGKLPRTFDSKTRPLSPGTNSFSIPRTLSEAISASSSPKVTLSPESSTGFKFPQSLRNIGEGSATPVNARPLFRPPLASTSNPSLDPRNSQASIPLETPSSTSQSQSSSLVPSTGTTALALSRRLGANAEQTVPRHPDVSPARKSSSSVSVSQSVPLSSVTSPSVDVSARASGLTAPESTIALGVGDSTKFNSHEGQPDPRSKLTEVTPSTAHIQHAPTVDRTRKHHSPGGEKYHELGRRRVPGRAKDGVAASDGQSLDGPSVAAFDRQVDSPEEDVRRPATEEPDIGSRGPPAASLGVSNEARKARKMAKLSRLRSQAK
ncbi:hypothetical protein FRB90_002069, partial [Tulasnella sp. 427]